MKRWGGDIYATNGDSWPGISAPQPVLPPTLPGGAPWPRISIVTPSFNQGRYIEETILSVANQGYPNVEHIVIDGGSTDDTSAIVDRHRDRLAHFVSERDRGQSHAINKGMDLATGDILTWLNSDDLLAPGALASIAMAFHTSRADMVAGMAALFSQGGMAGCHLTSCEDGPLPLDEILDLDGGWHAGKFFYQPEVMFTRELWDRAGAQVREDLHYSMDYDLWVRFAELGARLHVIGRPVAWFRKHDEQKTTAEHSFKKELKDYVREYAARKGPLPLPAAPPARLRQRLRIVLLNDHGYRYGAGLAHQRMAESLALAGHELRAISLLHDSVSVTGARELSSLDLLRAVADHAPDLVLVGNLHSAATDLTKLGHIIQRYPTLCVLHDMWWFTGRCAYPEDCEKYLTGCDSSCPTPGEYPQLDPRRIAAAWEQKCRTHAGEARPFLLANSDWTHEFAQKTLEKWQENASKQPVERMKLSFPLDVFRPRDKRACRLALDLPGDKFIVMLSGDLYDRRKRTWESLEALASLHLDDLVVVSLGQKRDGEAFPLPDVRRLGFVSDPEHLAMLYSAADLYIGNSLQETFGQVFIEAAAAGTPVLAHRSTGVAEAVAEGITGFFVDTPTPAALAEAILRLYRDPSLRDDLARWGRIYVENEWSQFSAYRRMFIAWRLLGLSERLRIAPQIFFPPHPSAVPEPERVRSSQLAAVEALDLGEEEGPYDDLGLPKFRWALGPVSRLRLYARCDGIHTLAVRYRNVCSNQSVRLRLDGKDIGIYALPVTGYDTGRLLCVRAPLKAGSNLLEMEFADWARPGNDNRDLALILTGVQCLPDASAADARLE